MSARTVSHSHDELLTLVTDYCNGTISGQAGQRLGSLLKASDEGRRVYVAYLDLHLSLRQLSHDVPAAEQDAASGAAVQPTASLPTVATPEIKPRGDAAPNSPVLGFLGICLDRSASWIASPRVLGLAVVTSLAAYFLGLMISIAIDRAREPRAAQEHDAVAAHSPARVIADTDSRWTRRSPAANGDLSPRAGRSSLAAGVVEIEFSGGARVRIEGPAEFAARSGRCLELERGRLFAYVPRQARGFTVTTPTAEVIDLGTEFGVEVDGQGSTDLHVIRGRVEVKRASTGLSPRPSERLTAGEAIRVSGGGVASERIAIDTNRFSAVRSPLSATVAAAESRRALPFRTGASIWLGNLFDDGPHAPLGEAMRTDAFRATADFNDLGVHRVDYGGDSVKEIAQGILFDFKNLGWTASTWGNVSNDAYDGQSVAGLNGIPGGIRTLGTSAGRDDHKIEEGIGQHANAIVTFDLEEIRVAGGLEGRKLKFVCDRAGINDTGFGQEQASVHMAVIVAGSRGVQSAAVAGGAAEVEQRGNIWSIVSPIGEPQRGDGKFVAYRVVVPAEARWLTLVATSAGENHMYDHAVWSGARLEILP